MIMVFPDHTHLLFCSKYFVSATLATAFKNPLETLQVFRLLCDFFNEVILFF